MGQVARDFDLTETAVREWVRQVDVDPGKRDGHEREAEVAQLRRENWRPREGNEILKRAFLSDVIYEGALSVKAAAPVGRHD